MSVLHGSTYLLVWHRRHAYCRHIPEVLTVQVSFPCASHAWHGPPILQSLCVDDAICETMNAGVSSAVLTAIKEISRLPEGRDALKSAGARCPSTRDNSFAFLCQLGNLCSSYSCSVLFGT